MILREKFNLRDQDINFPRIGEKILIRELFLVQDHMNIKMQFLNMVVNKIPVMDLVLD